MTGDGQETAGVPDEEQEKETDIGSDTKAGT